MHTWVIWRLTINSAVALRWASSLSSNSWVTSNTPLRLCRDFLLATRVACIEFDILGNKKGINFPLWPRNRQLRNIAYWRVCARHMHVCVRERKFTWLSKTTPPSISFRLFSRKVVPLLTRSTIASAIPIFTGERKLATCVNLDSLFTQQLAS